MLQNIIPGYHSLQRHRGMTHENKKIRWVGRSALMLEGNMKEKTVPGAVDLRGKASLREKHLK